MISFEDMHHLCQAGGVSRRLVRRGHVMSLVDSVSPLPQNAYRSGRSDRAVAPSMYDVLVAPVSLSALVLFRSDEMLNS